MKKIIMSLVVAASLVMLNLLPATALAANSNSCSNSKTPQNEVLNSVNMTNQTNSGCDTSGINKLVGAAVSILSYVVGVAAVIAIIAAGFKYITSGGDTQKIANAKGTLVWAMVGIVVAALAQVLVHFVINTINNKVPGT